MAKASCSVAEGTEAQTKWLCIIKRQPFVLSKRLHTKEAVRTSSQISAHQVKILLEAQLELGNSLETFPIESKVVICKGHTVCVRVLLFHGRVTYPEEQLITLLRTKKILKLPKIILIVLIIIHARCLSIFIDQLLVM